MVHRVKGESSALISASPLPPLLRSLLSPFLSFSLPSVLLSASTQLPSSHFLLFLFLKKHPKTTIKHHPSPSKEKERKPQNLLQPPSHLTYGSTLTPPFLHEAYSMDSHPGSARGLRHTWGEGTS